MRASLFFGFLFESIGIYIAFLEYFRVEEPLRTPEYIIGEQDPQRKYTPNLF